MPGVRIRLAAGLAAALAGACAWAAPAVAQAGPPPECRAAAPATVCTGGRAGDFSLILDGVPARVVTDPGDHAGLRRAAGDLRDDLARVAGQAAPANFQDGDGRAVIVGTLGHSALIDRLAAEGRIDAAAIEGVWEAYLIQTVQDPAPGLDEALVIAGADMRGAIFGAYDLSRAAGVSPWVWWADAPVDRRAALHVSAGARDEAPGVRYRGIFLNDENPALYGWVNETYGGFNHLFYEEVFELILRLKGNYLWPAMWGKAFSDDDPLNPGLADAYGVVIGTSHHEPLMRAHVEWARHGDGPWDYTRNADRLREFWREGVERMGDHESLVTIGMRGDGDEAMTEGTAINLLETIVADQRAIIEDVTGAPAAQTPQVWALYKEVQDYYDQGMTAPDDVTLLFADDNWGNIRRLPDPDEPREGGYGVYYHFDYVGGPRNYKWLNTTQIERTWEQMNLTWEYGADEIWIVNVGDLKPMELPISFFLDHAWDPEAMTLEAMSGYTEAWAAELFGAGHGAEIGELLTRYTQYNARRKPELITPETYSLVNYNEAERILDEWRILTDEADRLRAALPQSDDDAFVQLVWFPIHASATLNALHIETARNRHYAAQGRRAANAAAARVEALFARDTQLQRIYEEDVADGKWVHMMSQTHISYTGWQQPDEDVLPELDRVDPPAGAALGVAVEGDRRAWSGEAGAPVLVFEEWGASARWIDLFNRGAADAVHRLEPSAGWIELSAVRGEADARVEVSVDWSALEPGAHTGSIEVFGRDGPVATVDVRAVRRAGPVEAGHFIEADGYVAIEAESFAEAVAGGTVDWTVIPELGRTGSGVTSLPATAPPSRPGGASPHLTYQVWLSEAGAFKIDTIISPTLDFRGQGGLRYAISVNDETPQIVNIHADGREETWADHVADSVAVHTPSTQSRPWAHIRFGSGAWIRAWCFRD